MTVESLTAVQWVLFAALGAASLLAAVALALAPRKPADGHTAPLPGVRVLSWTVVYRPGDPPYDWAEAETRWREHMGHQG